MPDGNVLSMWFETLLTRLGKLERHAERSRKENEQLKAEMAAEKEAKSKFQGTVDHETLALAVGEALDAVRAAQAEREKALEARNTEALLKLAESQEKRLAEVQAEAEQPSSQLMAAQQVRLAAEA